MKKWDIKNFIRDPNSKTNSVKDEIVILCLFKSLFVEHVAIKSGLTIN